MKKSKMAYIFLSLVLSVSFFDRAYCSSEWDASLKHPNKEKLVVLESFIAASPQRCRSDISPLQEHRTQLFELICGGNSSAFLAALLISECWDGGGLEDFYRSAGIFFEKQPLAFLQIIKKKAIQDSDLSDMLTMLPLDTVDNINFKLSMVENRIAILKTIREASLKEKREKGLSFLENEKKLLERIRVEMGEPQPR